MADTISLRIARPSDLAAVDALFARSYPSLLKGDYPPSTRVLALPILARANPKLLASGTYHVAEDERGAIIGAGGWSHGGPRGAHRPGVGNVRHLVTDHRHVRRGVATAIMRRVATQARASGVGLLDCLSTRPGVAFYRTLGFEEVGPVEVGLRPGITFPTVRMTRRL